MNIIVLATASRISGALTIYRQFLSYLSQYTSSHHFYLFIDSSMNHPVIPGVLYVFDDKHSWIHRILLGRNGLKKWCKSHQLRPDVVVSLQNTGTKMNCPQLIYYHQPLPFFEKKWNPLKKSEIKMFLYKHFYPYFVASTLNKRTDVVVQIPFIKKGFVKCFGIESDRVHVLFPDTEKIITENVPCANLDSECFHFVYPAIAEPYKEHVTLIEAVSLLKERNLSLVDKLRFYFTFTAQENPQLEKLIREKKLGKQFVLGGRVSHKELLSIYKSSTAFLFPSTIETLGLPLLEAASFGLPILAVDLPYSREVIGRYEGAQFISPKDISSWANALESLCLQPKKYTPVESLESSWPDCYKLIFKLGREPQSTDKPSSGSNHDAPQS